MKENEDYTRKVIKLIFHTVNDEVIDSDYFWLSDEPSEAETRAMMKELKECAYVEAYTFWGSGDMVVNDSSMRHAWDQRNI